MIRDIFANAHLKRWIKIVHIIFAGCALGGLISILALTKLKQGGKLQGNAFPIDFSILKIFSVIVNYSFFGILGTAFLYEFFTEWGFLKYKWIIAKWTIVGFLFILTIFGLGPAINGMASISDAGFHETVLKAQYIQFTNKVIIFTLLELLCMFILMVTSVIKPWGKIRASKFISKRLALCIVLPLLITGTAAAVMQSVRLNEYRKMPIKNTVLSEVKDGFHEGKAVFGNYSYKVRVYVEGNKISKIEAVDSRKSPYVTYAEGVFSKIIKAQNANIDTVTGATTTSKAYMKAVENALDGSTN
jgi:uncharacterized protein with FMN-binding domain